MRTRDEFLSELTRFGPNSSAGPFSLEEAQEYCRKLARSHYENFAVASLFLPKQFRDPFFAVYAYCRWSDDLADETDNPEQSLALLDWWEGELRQCGTRARQPETHSAKEGVSRFIHPVFVVLEPLFRDFPALTVEPFADLLTAFRRDQTQTRYTAYADLLDYCRYSANPVGRILLALISPNPTEEMLRWSDSLCTGLQLVNFWQDVRRDAENGRRYIPDDIFQIHGSEYDTVRFLTADAFRCLESARPLIAAVPRDFRRDIALFIEGGETVLRRIEKIGYQVQKIRPKLRGIDFLKMMIKVLRL